MDFLKNYGYILIKPTHFSFPYTKKSVFCLEIELKNIKREKNKITKIKKKSYKKQISKTSRINYKKVKVNESNCVFLLKVSIWTILLLCVIRNK